MTTRTSKKQISKLEELACYSDPKALFYARYERDASSKAYAYYMGEWREFKNNTELLETMLLEIA